MTKKLNGATRKTATRFLTLREVLLRISLSRAMVYRLIRQKKFPSGYKLSDRRVGWAEHEVDAWISDRMTR